MARKIFTDESLATLVSEIKAYINNAIASADEVYVGTTEPTDPNIQVWINPAEEWTGTVQSQDRLVNVSLPKSGWKGTTNPWSQTVTISGLTTSSKLDLSPTAQQIVSLQEQEITLMMSNENGVAVAYAIGGKPATDMNMQVLISEVVVAS